MKFFTISFLLFLPALLQAQISDSTFQKRKIESELQILDSLIAQQNDSVAFIAIKSIETPIGKYFGSTSKQFARFSFLYGSYYENKGDLQNAIKFYKKSILSYNEIGDSISLNMAKSLNALAGLYLDLGQADEAEDSYLLALKIRGKLLGLQHIDYAKILNNLAGVAQLKGDYSKSMELFVQASKIIESSIGINNEEYATNLHNQGNVNFEQGDFKSAESNYSQALKIRENLTGRQNPSCAATLNCLGNVYSSLGLVEKALEYYLEALSIYEKTIGENQLESASCISNIAGICSEERKFDIAENYYLKSLEIYSKTIGNNNPDYAMCLDNMANMYFSMRNNVKAEALYKQSLKIREKIFGVDHPEYASSLNNIGSFYCNTNQFKESEIYLNKAKTVWQNIFGKEHPDYLLSINNLISLYWLSNNYDKLKNNITESTKLEQKLVIRASKHLSEEELSIYLKTFTSNLDRLYSLQYSMHTLSGLCFNNALFYKGYLLNAVSNFNKIASHDINFAEKFKQLKQYNASIAKELALPTSERSNNTIKNLESKANEIEKALVSNIKGLGETRKNIEYSDVRKALKPDEVAIEFINFKLGHPGPTDSIVYAALLLKSGDQPPQFITLFEEKSLDSILQSKVERRLEYVNKLYSFASRGTTSIQAKKRSLADLIFNPLAKELAGIHTIYYSPSGLLHRINLDAIPVSETETFADSYNLVELNSTRQLAVPNVIKISNNEAVLFGGIKFDTDSSILSDESLLASRTSNQQSSSQANPQFSAGSWDYLPGTDREVNAIDKIMKASDIKTTLKRGYDGTEETFKNIGANNTSSPRILHIATHGYFYTESKETTNTNSSRNRESVFKISDNPMLRSGLILAGGNNTWKGGLTTEGKEDGILTAYEISQMNLSNTELVVLSACETGLGEINGNEGVYGLQRAFKIAGAKYLIMSLWQVPDKQTSLLMTNFYKKWLEEKMSIPDAFHAAQKDLRDVGLDPYYWAGFVLVE